MALTTLTGTVTGSVNVTGTLTYTENSTPTGNIADSLSVSLSVGSTAGQSNNIWSDQRGLAASGSEKLNISGGVTAGAVALYPVFSSATAATAAMAFTKISTVFIRNLSSVADIAVFGEGTGADFTAAIGANGDKVNIRPGGCLLISVGSSDSTMYAVAADEVLQVGNNSGAATATYSVTIIGVTA